jgi:hypothetical protein
LAALKEGILSGSNEECCESVLKLHLVSALSSPVGLGKLAMRSHELQGFDRLLIGTKHFNVLRMDTRQNGTMSLKVANDGSLT